MDAIPNTNRGPLGNWYRNRSESQFEPYEDHGGEWRWRLCHLDGEIIGASDEDYDRQNDAQESMQAVRCDADGTSVLVIESEEEVPGVGDTASFVFAEDVESKATFELYEGEDADHHWQLRHRNGNILATGTQGYSDRTGVWDGIESVKRNALNADLEELGV